MNCWVAECSYGLKFVNLTHQSKMRAVKPQPEIMKRRFTSTNEFPQDCRHVAESEMAIGYQELAKSGRTVIA
jgi:hypothetical protein